MATTLEATPGGVAAAARSSQTDRLTPPEPGAVLDVLLRNMRPRSGRRRGLADELVHHLAQRLGASYSKATLHNKRTQKTAMTPSEIAYSAEFLDVPVDLFFGSHLTALSWLIAHRPDVIPCKRSLADASSSR